jgi:hypothetical protein
MVLCAIEQVLGKPAAKATDDELRSAFTALKRMPDDQVILRTADHDEVDDDPELEEFRREAVRDLKRTPTEDLVRTVRATLRQKARDLATIYAPIYPEHALRLASS